MKCFLSLITLCSAFLCMGLTYKVNTYSEGDLKFADFEIIQVNDTRETVWHILGAPSEIAKYPHFEVWAYNEEPSTEIGYSFYVGFDSHGKITVKTVALPKYDNEFGGNIRIIEERYNANFRKITAACYVNNDDFYLDDNLNIDIRYDVGAERVTSISWYF